MRRDPLRRGAPFVAALAAGLTLLAFPGAAAAERPADGATLATVTVYANGVDFLPLVPTGGAVVSVAGSGLELSRSFAAGEPLSIGLFDAEGQLLPDGTYTWELELLPDAATARALRAAAERNGGEAPDAWRRLHGSFTLRDGLVADPELVEAAPAPARAPAGALPTILAGPPAEAPVVEDTDELVGSRRGVERRSRAAAARAEATAPPHDGEHFERSDAAAAARGGALATRPTPVSDTPLDPRRIPDDGADGRDRPAEHR